MFFLLVFVFVEKGITLMGVFSALSKNEGEKYTLDVPKNSDKLLIPHRLVL